MIIIDAEKRKSRYRVIVGNHEFYLTFGMMKLLLKLCTPPGKWISVYDIDKHGNGARYIYRLKKELTIKYLEEESLCLIIIDNDRQGHYRLVCENRVEIKWHNLMDTDDVEIENMFDDELEKIEEHGEICLHDGKSIVISKPKG